MKTRVYISIPIKGKDYNYQRDLANKVAQQFQERGYDTITPFDICPSATTPYNVAMGKCIEELLNSDEIFMCDGWENSDGCKAEFQVALIYGKKIMTGQNG